MSAKKSKTKKVVRKLKLKHPVKLEIDPAKLPVPVNDLVEAIKAKEVVEIVFVNPDTTRWERIKARLANL